MSTRLSGTPPDFGADEAAMQAFIANGEKRAYALANRGPIRFTPGGALHSDILDAYWRHGFYIFEAVLRCEELRDIEADVTRILERLPSRKGSGVDAKGRPALGADCEATTLFWSRPLGDPFGGTDLANGRHPVQMAQPTPAADAPKEVVYLILGSLQFSDACLRVYGHPQLLAVAAAVNGNDFAPFNETPFVYEPLADAPGRYHWDPRAKPDLQDYNLLDLSI